MNVTPTVTNPAPSVLIVGAGPTGLMLACQLTRFGIPYRIIEQHSGPTTESRALAIQPRSLELFAQMDLAAPAVAFGVGQGGCYLVRPDMYIAYRSAGFDAAHLEHYLAQFLLPTPRRRPAAPQDKATYAAPN